MLRKLSYRPDIDGLRALAVISVILFHVNPNYMPSGFLGVDIFFVISGFLITSIIYREMAEGTFSFANFYNRRIKRILPVFFVVLIVGLLVVWWLFLTKDYHGIGNSALSAVLFLSNIYFSRVEGGYFDIGKEELPFAHIWSLSVEEQFYFIFPLILLFIFRNNFLKKHKIGTLVAGGGILVLLSFVNLQKIGLSLDSYYLPHLRMIELLVGSILSVFLLEKGNSLSRIQSNILGIFSLLLLLVCFYLKNFFIPPFFPGILALLPCFLVALLILANEKGEWITNFFSRPFVVWIGKLSYSLYLWHWVVLAIFRYFFGAGEILIFYELLIVILTFLLSVFSYYSVEQFFRYKKYSFKKSFIFFYLLPAIVVVLIRTQMEIAINDNSEIKNKIELSYPLECHNKEIGEFCMLGDKNTPPQVLVVGDSHAGHLAPFINMIGAKEKWAATLLSSDSCAEIGFLNSSQSYSDNHCGKVSAYFAKEYVNYNVIVFDYFYFGRIRWLFADYQDFINRFKYTIKQLLGKGKKVYVINSSLNVGINVWRLEKLRQRTNINTELTKSYKENSLYLKSLECWHKVKEDILKEYPDVKTIDLSIYIPDDLKIDGNYIMVDTDHWNIYGSKKIAEQFIKDGKRLIREEDLK